MELQRLFEACQTIVSDTLWMRPVCEEDAELLLPMYSDSQIYRYRPGLPRTTPALVGKLIKRFRQSMEKGESAAFTVFEKAEELSAVGVMEIFHLDPRVEQVEIGYTIDPGNQGRGIATEAVGAVTDYLIWQIGFNRVRATVHVDNLPSRRVLLKNGFLLEGVERQGEFWQGIGFVDICRFAKLRMDYGEERRKI